MDSIDFSIVVNSLESRSNKGPTGYNLESILRALLVQQIENIPNRAALVRRLKQDPVVRYVCGFHVAGRTPSEATMSRYYKKISDDNSLEDLFYQLVDQAIKADIIDTNTLAIDSTKLESYERAKPKKKVDKEDYSTPDWGAKYDTHRNKITWFGWKIHLVSDVKGELPLDFTITPPNEADCEQALPLVSRVTRRLRTKNYQIPEYWTMDSGYDYEKI